MLDDFVHLQADISGMFKETMLSFDVQKARCSICLLIYGIFNLRMSLLVCNLICLRSPLLVLGGFVCVCLIIYHSITENKQKLIKIIIFNWTESPVDSDVKFHFIIIFEDSEQTSNSSMNLNRNKGCKHNTYILESQMSNMG